MKERPSARAAFTLIELLIVIAIIAILALIAIPNFLEAQTRAKVSRCMADMKSLATAYEAFKVDRNMMLVDFWGDDCQKGKDRIRIDFGITTQMNAGNNRGGTAGIYVPLTTPVAYMSSIPVDYLAVTMAVGQNLGYSLVDEDTWKPHTFIYFCHDDSLNDSNGTTHDGRGSMPLDNQNGDYLFVSPGPDQSYVGNILLYDPTNGTISKGEIIYSNRHSFAPRYDR